MKESIVGPGYHLDMGAMGVFYFKKGEENKRDEFLRKNNVLSKECPDWGALHDSSPSEFFYSEWDTHQLECMSCGNWEELNVDDKRSDLHSFETKEMRVNEDGEQLSQVKCIECGTEFNYNWTSGHKVKQKTKC